jgi:hypothetical protein
MSELDDFLTPTLAASSKPNKRCTTATPVRVWRCGRPGPVTVLGAVRSASGWEVSQLFRWLGSGFSDCSSYRFELVTAGVSWDLAYTVGYEHTTVSWDGTPLDPYALRVTRLYRREDGEWKIVHRNADVPDPERSRRRTGGELVDPGPTPSSGRDCRWSAVGTTQRDPPLAGVTVVRLHRPASRPSRRRGTSSARPGW